MEIATRLKYRTGGQAKAISVKSVTGPHCCCDHKKGHCCASGRKKNARLAVMKRAPVTR